MDVLDPNSFEYAMRQFLRSHYLATHQLLNGLKVHPGQSQILFMLWEKDGRTQKEFTQNLRLTPATVSVMLQRMEQKGLVRRGEDTEDLRANRIYLSEAGRAICPQLAAAHRQINDRCLAGFSPEERILFRRLLLQASQNLTI